MERDYVIVFAPATSFLLLRRKEKFLLYWRLHCCCHVLQSCRQQTRCPFRLLRHHNFFFTSLPREQVSPYSRPFPFFFLFVSRLDFLVHLVLSFHTSQHTMRRQLLALILLALLVLGCSVAVAFAASGSESEGDDSKASPVDEGAKAK